MVLFIGVSVSTAYLVVRYTKPLYESSSLLKLDFENEANSLGLSSNAEAMELAELSGEIELLKSKLFFSRVADVVGMDISYYYKGSYLVDERYRNSPFVVSYLIKDPTYYDRPFTVFIDGNQSFKLQYGVGGKLVEEQYRYGAEISTDHFNLKIDLTPFYEIEKASGEYFFILNSDMSVIKYFEQNVTVYPENYNARTIRIALKDYNKYKAQDLLQAIDTLYLEYTRREKNVVLEQKIAFLDNQIEETEKRLEDFENYFEQFTIDYRTTNLSKDMNQAIEQIEGLDSARFELNLQISDLNALINQLDDGNVLNVNPSFLGALPGMLQKQLTDYVDIQEERTLKLNTYNENTYVIQQLDDQLEVLLSRIRQSTRDHVRTLTQRLAQIQGQRTALEANFMELPSLNTEYNKNQRFYDLQQDFYMMLRRSKTELQITKAGTVTNFVVLSSADLPSVPIKPQPMLIYGIGVVAGFLLSLFFVLVRYLLNNRINSLSELERISDVPVIGVLPFHKGKASETRLVVKSSNATQVSEALRAIRTNMEFLQDTKKSRRVSVTSTVSGEGKTFVTVNLAAIFALSGQKVCLIDLDMRKPKVHTVFEGGHLSKGMSTLLIGKDTLDDCVQCTKLERLDFISAGPIPPNPSELLLSDNLDRLFDILDERYDMVLVDTPPAGLVTDAVLVMKKTALQMYVVRCNYSKRSFIRSLENLKYINQFKNLTVIFNSVANQKNAYGYGDGAAYTYYESQ